MRKIFEALGATVNWDESTQTITASRASTTISMRMGSAVAYKNGQEIPLDQEPVISNNTTFVPLRFIAESFGAKVQWIESNNRVVVETIQ